MQTYRHSLNNHNKRDTDYCPVRAVVIVKPTYEKKCCISKYNNHEKIEMRTKKRWNANLKQQTTITEKHI